MKNILKTITLILIFSVAAKADKIHENTNNAKSTAPAQIRQILDQSDIVFEASLENDEVRGIQSASYYFDGNSGLLYVKFDDKELIYKDVPLNVWMEWKFSDAISTYYRENIKYDYIHI